ncbi:MAG TPA: AAA family ATPase [Spirochaetota bacterium]|nr:AAA family ATPase [Spirochaetota bacterium]HOL56927.1 AAA family ATPase [Spirochaetota bacterium]HPP04641.1 AAA family ATPase [Spirochaetota bacterium]
MFQKYLRLCTEKVIHAINIGTMELANLKQTVFTPEFILLGIIEQDDSIVYKILEQLTTDPLKVIEKITDSIYSVQPKNDGPLDIVNIALSPDVEKLFEIALDEARKFNDKFISTGTLFLAFFNSSIEPAATILYESGLRYHECREALANLKGSITMDSKDSESKEDVLKVYGTNLTELAQLGKLDPVIGREDEIARIIEILARRTKNNPIIIGQPGVGKTVLIEGLAQLIVNSRVPETLLNKKIIQIDVAQLTAGAKFKGEFEERVKNLVDALINSHGKVISFIDEIQTLIDASGGGTIRAVDIMKPALAKGQIQLIGTTSIDIYKKTIEKDKTLSRRFQPVTIEEPTIEETINILNGLKTKYEEHHKVVYSKESIESAARMSHRYINDRFLPDKAVDLIDEAGARKHLNLITIPPDIQNLEKEKVLLKREQTDAFVKNKIEEVVDLQQKINKLENRLTRLKEDWLKSKSLNDNIVNEEDIAEVVSRITGIPVNKIVETESEKLKTMEEKLHKRIVGQNEAIIAVSNAIRRNRAGLKDSNRPIGAFLFLGPTGVGKTELAKALAEFLFDDENKIIRLDMSEYMEKHSVSKMIGSPPGYVGYDEGGQLTEKIRRSPYSIVLLDEIEKAHEDVFNILLQIFDEGRLTDSQGVVVSFKNAIIIGTSNLGSSHVFDFDKRIGFTEKKDSTTNYELIKEKILEETKKFFKPEFLNRIDDLIVFHPLQKSHIIEITELLLSKLKEKVEKSGYFIEFTKQSKEKLAELGYSPEFGARPLKRVIENYIENPISFKIISGEIKKNDKIKVSVKDGKIDIICIKERDENINN